MTRSRLSLFALSLMLWSGLVFLATSHKFSAIMSALDLSEPIAVIMPTDAPPPPPPPKTKEIEPMPEPLVMPLTTVDPPTTTTIPGPPLYVAPPAQAKFTDVTWLQRPGAREIDRYYPPRASDREKEGRVLLNCTVNADGTINCKVASETPEGWGFGAAALQVAKYFKMAPQTVNGAPTSGGSIDVPLTFRLGR